MKVRPTLPLVIVVVALLASALTPRAARSRQGGPGVGQTAPSSGGLYYALVIGDDDYISLPKIGTAAADARSVERMPRVYLDGQVRGGCQTVAELETVKGKHACLSR